MDALLWVAGFTFILAWVFIAIQMEVLKKLKQEMKLEVSHFKHKNNVANQDLQLTQFRLNETGNLNRKLRWELDSLKRESSFVKKAIQDKVRKRKIRGKRRKSA